MSFITVQKFQNTPESAARLILFTKVGERSDNKLQFYLQVLQVEWHCVTVKLEISFSQTSGTELLQCTHAAGSIAHLARNASVKTSTQTWTHPRFFQQMKSRNEITFSSIVLANSQRNPIHTCCKTTDAAHRLICSPCNIQKSKSMLHNETNECPIEHFTASIDWKHVCESAKRYGVTLHCPGFADGPTTASVVTRHLCCRAKCYCATAQSKTVVCWSKLHISRIATCVKTSKTEF